MPTLYPVMLNLEGRTCVVIGGGTVATRKVQGLLDAGASVTVISPAVDPALLSLADAGKITVRQVAHTLGMLSALRPLLVFAATDDPLVNQQAAEEAHSIGALVNSVDEYGNHDFMNMATVRRGEITIALSTGGTAPALAAHLQRLIEQVIGDEYLTLGDWMAAARLMVLAGVQSQSQRAAVWRHVLESSILDSLRQGETISARQLFDRIIQEALDTPS